MNKSELVKKIAVDTELSKKDSEKALNSILSNITEQLASGESVALVGFGTFKVKHRDERKGRNPQTGEEITIKAATLPVWKASKELLSK